MKGHLMPITTAMCNSFKQELLGGVHDLDTDVIKVALISDTHTGTYGAATTEYADVSAEEASGAGYTTDDKIVGGATIVLDGSTAYVDFANKIFSAATVAADGCLLYNSSKNNRAIAVFSFGGTVSSSNGDFTIVFPTDNATSAVIRIS
jgi:hypothetical protein